MPALVKRFENIRILGTGSYKPGSPVSDETLADVLRDCMGLTLTASEMSERLGTGSRHFAAHDERAVDMLAVACKRALDMACVDPKDLDALFTSTTPQDYITPPPHTIVANMLGMRNQIEGGETNVACTGVVHNIQQAAYMLAEGHAKLVLVAGVNCFGHPSQRRVRWARKHDPAIFGDGAGAMLLGHDDTSEPWSITRVDTPQYYHTICMPNPSGSIVKPPFSSDVEHGFLMGERQETFFAHMESELMPHVRSFMRAVGITDESGNFINMPELVIGHQPSGPLFAKGVELSGIPLSQFVQNFKKYGNTISAELPMTLDDAVRDGTLTRGMRVLFWVYGAGYTEGIVYLTY